MNFDMNSCWSRGVELVTSNFQLLSAIAAIFFLLPNIAIYLLMPDMQTLSDPMADQQVVQARMAEILLPFIGVMIVSLIVQFVGYGTMVGLMSDERPTVGQALSTALKAMPSLIAVFVIFALAYILGAFLIILPFSILGGVAGSPFLAILGILPILVFVTWLMARFSMSLPVMILENRLNPLTATRRLPIFRRHDDHQRNHPERVGPVRRADRDGNHGAHPARPRQRHLRHDHRHAGERAGSGDVRPTGRAGPGWNRRNLRVTRDCNAIESRRALA